MDKLTYINAVESGSLEQLERCRLENTASLEERNYESTPLLLAAQKGNGVIVQKLLEWGARTDAKCHGMELIDFAVLSNNVEIVRLVLDNTSNHVTSFCLEACVLKDKDPAIFALFEERKVNFDARDSYGENLIHKLINNIRHSKNPTVCDAKTVTQLQKLFSLGVNINGKNSFGITPLHYAAGMVNQQMMQMLIEAGADIFAKDDRGNGPMAWLLFENDPEVAIKIQNEAIKHKMIIWSLEIGIFCLNFYGRYCNFKRNMRDYTYSILNYKIV
jgi:ankyrin repeat protein